MPAAHWTVSILLATIGPTLAPGQERTPIVISPAQEIALGAKALEEFFESHSLSTDGNLALRVDEMGRVVA